MSWTRFLMIALTGGLAVQAARRMSANGKARAHHQRGKAEHAHAVQRWETEGGLPVTPELPHTEASTNPARRQVPAPSFDPVASS